MWTITARYHGPSNFRGSRFTVTSDILPKATIPYDHSAYNAHREAIREYLRMHREALDLAIRLNGFKEEPRICWGQTGNTTVAVIAMRDRMEEIPKRDRGICEWDEDYLEANA